MTGDALNIYSVTFDSGTEQKNTWTDWGLIPESPPIIDPPEPVTNFVTIPGRTAGALDLSKSVFGKLTYNRMSGSWSFLKEISNRTERITTYEAIRYWLHGRTCKAILGEDPNHYYQGMFIVGAPQLGANALRVTISFNLEPVRYNTNGSIDTNYVQSFPA